MLAILAAAALAASSQPATTTSTITIQIHIESISIVTVLDHGGAMWTCRACGEYGSSPLIEVDGEMVALQKPNVMYSEKQLLAMASERKQMREALAQSALARTAGQ